MCSIPGRSATALLVIDVQNGVVDGAWKRDEVVGNVVDLVHDARRHHVPVIWVQHSDEGLAKDSDDWQLVPELQPRDSEPIIHKNFRSSFEQTDLDAVLEAAQISHLVVCGAQTEYCVRNTVHAAYERGYDVTLVEDAHTTHDIKHDHRMLLAHDIVAAQNIVCAQYELPGRTCTVASTDDAFASIAL